MSNWINIGVTQALARVAEDADFDRQLIESSNRLRDAFISVGWPPPWHLPVTHVRRLANAVSEGELTHVEFEALVVEVYDEKLLVEVLQGWREQTFLTTRLPILEEAIWSHSNQRFYSAVCTILPQIEGVIGDFFRRRPNPKNDASDVFRGSGLSQAAQDFYVRFVNEQFQWGEDPPAASRHAILHGQDTRFGTAATSLKLLLTFDVVQAGIGDRRAELESGDEGDGATKLRSSA